MHLYAVLCVALTSDVGVPTRQVGLFPVLLLLAVLFPLPTVSLTLPSSTALSDLRPAVRR